MKHYKNKFISVLLSVMIAVAWSVPAFADDVTTETDPGAAADTTVEKTEPTEPVKEEQPEEW